MRVIRIPFQEDELAVESRPVHNLTTERIDMKLHVCNVKYLICIILLCLRSFSCEVLGNEHPSSHENAIRQRRNIFDFFLRRFRSCDSCVCGRANQFGDSRFLAGEHTTAHEFPWLANIHMRSRSVVGGVLINDRYILTAASQILNVTPSDIKVSLGEYDRCALDLSSINISVDSIILYPHYNPESHAHDLALIRFSRPIRFEDRVSPICLPNLLSIHLERVATLVGWPVETANINGNRTCRPRKLALPILDYNQCLKSGINPINFHNDSGCAGILGTSSFACESDAGSAVQYRTYMGIFDLIGIVSDGNKCDNNTGSAIFTKIEPHLNWLSEETRDACYCSKY